MIERREGETQEEYRRRYQVEHNKVYCKAMYTKYNIRFKNIEDADIIEHLDRLKADGGKVKSYICEAIREKMEREVE